MLHGVTVRSPAARGVKSISFGNLRGMNSQSLLRKTFPVTTSELLPTISLTSLTIVVNHPEEPVLLLALKTNTCWKKRAGT